MPPRGPTLREYYEALRAADERFAAERDRRYAEVAVEREKALKIKDEADKAALGLAREIQTYKDEKANDLREQIGSERGHYASKEDLGGLGDKIDAILKPLIEYVAGQQGRGAGLSAGWGYLLGAVGLVAAVISVIAR